MCFKKKEPTSKALSVLIARAQPMNVIVNTIYANLENPSLRIYCPACGAILIQAYTDRYTQYKYCPYCGQRIQMKGK